ncbi:MAG: hypothetical protein R6U15_08255 [Candidatus Izemoplasmatales bacterium]
MKTAIIYYSKTGNTELVAKQFNDVKLLRVEAKSDNPNQKNPELTNIPEVKPYKHIVFASPVHGFQLAKVMNTYLHQVGDLNNKTIDLFVTHFFPFAWLGGNQSLKQMQKIIESKGGEIRYKTSVNWKSRKREKVIATMIKEYIQS